MTSPADLSQVKIPAGDLADEIKRNAASIIYILDARAGALAYQLAANQKARAEISLVKAEAISLTSQPAPLWQVEEVYKRFQQTCTEALDLALDSEPETVYPLEQEFREQWNAAREAQQ